MPEQVEAPLNMPGSGSAGVLASPTDPLVQICKVYESDDRPWIVTYSGGKDSTAVLQMVYYMLRSLPAERRRKPVHVVSNDTLVETPPIVDHMTTTLEFVQAAARRDGLPIVTQRTIPALKNRFFVKVIGRGYPAPTRFFRWCTDKMKIEPTNSYIKEQISKAGEVVILLGTRKSESPTRARTIKHYERLHGNGVLRPHSSLPGALLYAPIQEWSLEEVWGYLLQVPSPWGKNNRELWSLYGRASGSDCPLVLEANTPPCGNSRFGCWVCTVVRQDKSMEALVDNGSEWMEPLLEFRNWLKEIREDVSLREPRRRNGKEAPGPFTLQARQVIFRRLMGVETTVEMTLVPEEEKHEIQGLWELDGYVGPTVWEIEKQQKEALLERKNGNGQRGQTFPSGPALIHLTPAISSLSTR